MDLDITKEVSEALLALSRRVQQDKKQGRIKPTRIPVLRKVVESYSYQNGGVSATATTETVERETLQADHLYWELTSPTNGCPQLLAVAKALSKEFNEADHFGLYCVQRLVAAAVSRALCSPISQSEAIELALRFMGEVAGGPVQWNVVTHLDGIWLAGGPCVIGCGANIRATRKEDIEDEIPLRELETGYQSFDHHIPKAILELSIYARRDELEPFMERLLNTLRLFRVGSIRRLRHEATPDSLLQLGTASRGVAMYDDPFSYPVAPEDGPRIAALFDALSETVPDNPFPNPSDATAFEIAFHRYREALLNPTSIENRITLGVSALEALLLKKGERSELSLRLSQRASILTECLGRDVVEASSLVQSAYRIRSEYVHGAKMDRENSVRLRDCCEQVLDISRGALVLCGQLHAHEGKEAVVGKLDRALLSVPERERLGKELSKLSFPEQPSRGEAHRDWE